MPATSYTTVAIDGLEIFVREAGPADAPVVLLPHGYPSSSFQYRQLIPALADRWRVIAPDFPGFGYSATPARADFDYSFGGTNDSWNDSSRPSGSTVSPSTCTTTLGRSPSGWPAAAPT